MADSIRSMLPPSYERLFQGFFDRAKPVETRATCNRCSMCDHGDPSPVAMEFFDHETKCCTFWPILPNYLVGAILADESPGMAEGKRRIQSAIEKRIGVTPTWLSRPRKWTLLMQAYSDVFGRAKSLKCPYYDDTNPEGTCSIWRHRETICMTYYCKFSGGMRGYEYWMALKDYLGHVQRTLAVAATKEVDGSVQEPGYNRIQLTLEEMDDLPPKDSDYRSWWGRWVGREEEFYRKCHEWVSAVSVADFVKNVDETENGKKLLANLISKYEILDGKILPSSLVRNGRMREQHVGDKVVVTSYHRYDSFALDKDLFEVVGMFKADQTLEQNLERLQKEEGIELTPDLVEYLFAAGVLVEPTRGAVAEAKGDSAEVTGERSGRRAALLAILDARGLEADAVAKNRFDGATVAQLEQWIRRAAIAKTVDEVLTD